MNTGLVLSEQDLKEHNACEAAGYSLLQHDRSVIKKATYDAHVWLHFNYWLH